MTTASRLARVEAMRLANALRDFRATLDTFDAALARLLAGQTPEERAAEEAEATAEAPVEQAVAERLFGAVPVLRDPHATPAAVRRAITQLEPLVMPRGSPDYVIVGAIRRLFADWTREWVSEAMGGSHGDSSGALRAHDPGDSGGNKHGVMNA